MKKVVLLVLAISLLLSVICFTSSIAASTTPEMSIEKNALSYRDALCIKYAVKSNVDNVQLLVWTKISENGQYTVENAERVLNKVGYQTINSIKHWIFDLTGIYSTQMTDIFYTRVYCSIDGVDYYSEMNKYSVIDQVYKLRNNPNADPDEIELTTKMVEYGAAAQKKFNYNISRPANETYYKMSILGGALSDGFNHGLYFEGEKVKISAPDYNDDGIPFSHWEDESGAVISDTAEYIITAENANHTYKAVYSKTYTVTFKDWDGTTLKTQEKVLSGSSATAPTDPTRDGYTFIGWDKDFSNVTSDLTVTALYEVAICKHLSLNEFPQKDATATEAGNIEYWVCSSCGKYFVDANAETEILPEAVTKESTGYSVYFRDHDGTVLDIQMINPGDSAVTPEAPIRQGYTFTGWSGECSSINADTDITATYLKNYQVQFVDYNGYVLKTEAVMHGMAATAPITEPKRDGFRFIGWDSDYSSIQSDTTVKAVYEIITYMVTFADHSGNIVSEQYIEYGSSAIIPENMPDYVDWNMFKAYRFSHWSEDCSVVTENLQINGVYNEITDPVFAIKVEDCILDKNISEDYTTEKAGKKATVYILNCSDVYGMDVRIDYAAVLDKCGFEVSKIFSTNSDGSSGAYDYSMTSTDTYCNFVWTLQLKEGAIPISGRTALVTLYFDCMYLKEVENAAADKLCISISSNDTCIVNNDLQTVPFETIDVIINLEG